MKHDPLQAQLDAYNAHDLEAFVACYAPQVRIYDAGGALLVEGSDGVRARYGPLFASSPQLRAEVVQRTRIGTPQAWYAVDNECVTGRNEPGAPKRFAVLVLYAGRGDLIDEVRFLTPRLPLPD